MTLLGQCRMDRFITPLLLREIVPLYVDNSWGDCAVNSIATSGRLRVPRPPRHYSRFSQYDQRIGIPYFDRYPEHWKLGNFIEMPPETFLTIATPRIETNNGSG
jgi:hypothetical protein